MPEANSKLDKTWGQRHCATARNKGTCDNRLNIRRDALEKSILSGLNTHLMAPDLFKEFCQEFTREVNRRRIERSTDLESWRKESERIERELQKLLTRSRRAGLSRPLFQI